MTHEEVANMLAETGLDFAYYQFPEDTDREPPFLCFMYPNSDDMYADNQNYQEIHALTIELYTDVRDFDLEDRVKGVLRDHGFSWSLDEEQLDSERMHVTVFYTEVIMEG